ncbi:ribokinase [Microbacterium gorillae]|uniref:ribokinase n=1 Tax=Microbacterium gorillae TaxID=1231063 RepID=UPI003D995436
MTTGPALTVLGSINVDFIAHTVRAPRRGETVGGATLTREAGGKGANQAIAAARLGGDVRLVGAVGADSDGQHMIESLSRAGVDVAQMQTAAAPTGTALIVVDAEGENSIVVCPGANEHVAPDAIAIDPESAVLAQLEIPVDVVTAVANRTTGFFALNVSPAQPLPAGLAERVDLAIVNETELDELPELRNARILALTLGARGAVLYRNGVETARAAVAAPRVVSTVGAGDAFAAALTLGLLRGDDDATALHRACAVGAAAVTDPGSQPLLESLDTYAAHP